MADAIRLAGNSVSECSGSSDGIRRSTRQKKSCISNSRSRRLDSDDDEDVDKSEIGTRDEDAKEEEEDKSGTDSDSASEKSDSRPRKSGGKINRYGFPRFLF